ncbi:unnamed protein product [Protopolystoma xenopodis]|uniref:Uncharacterized protein n=1 Tax=Protopolystoma xenopodis TaxID=117903 RepID=A0A3S5CH89_9PLAT|nr:unnamed protein product [Protopolystoma xenopodis]
MRSEQGDPALPQVPRLVLDYLSLAGKMRAFLGDQLEPKLRVSISDAIFPAPSTLLYWLSKNAFLMIAARY